MFIKFNSHVFLMRWNETSLVIGLNNELCKRTTLTSNWIHIPTSGSVIGVTVLQDGTILGISLNNELYTCTNWTGNWVHISKGGSFIAVTVLKDETILGIGLNNELYTRANDRGRFLHKSPPPQIKVHLSF
jgi:hypothetical protein